MRPTRWVTGVARWRVACGAALVLVAVAAVLSIVALRGGNRGVAGFETPRGATAATGPQGSVATPPSAPASASASAPAQLSSPPGTAAARGGSGARLRDVDGGIGYYGKFLSPLPVDRSFFPVAVWFESVADASDTALDKATGINTYVELTDGSDLSLIRNAGMYAIASGGAGAGREYVGHVLADEVDMWGGPGTGTWTGNDTGVGDSCDPPGSQCGYTAMATIAKRVSADGRLRYTNYGKGVTFWESDAEAARFVNQYQDLLSADNYWFTDTNICAAEEGGTFFGGRTLSSTECHLAANYGRTVDRVRSLVSPAGSRPVWAFVEVGHPGDDSSNLTIQPQQAVAAVWSSLIHGARGIIYFNHSFGGACPTQHVLREPCYASIRSAISAVDARIRTLAPVLNSPFADGVLTPSAGVDASIRWYDGHFYVLAGSNQATAQTATFSIPCAGDAVATVLDENRQVMVRNGSFSDRFADGNAVHLYRIDRGSSCGAY